MADLTVTPASLPTQPNPEPLLSPEELETLERIIRNRNRGFLPTAAECDILIEIVQSHLGGGQC